MPRTENEPKKRTPAPKAIRPLSSSCSHQTSCDLPDPTPQTSERSKNTSRNAPLPRGVVIEVESCDSDDDRPPRLASPTPTPQKSGTSGRISPTPTPSISGTGGHIFRIPRRRPTTHDAPVDTPATQSAPTPFNQYLQHLHFRYPERTCDRHIHCPPDGDTGDGDGWYYVTVGRTVGVFNTW